tara:strand:+ start:9030 stop:10823 length:1794 start_codon:yes stop_codon:yes gene_type:complete
MKNYKYKLLIAVLAFTLFSSCYGDDGDALVVDTVVTPDPTQPVNPDPVTPVTPVAPGVNVINDFESSQGVFLVSDGVTSFVNSAFAGQIVNSGAAYEAASILPSNRIDMSSSDSQIISFDFYQDTAAEVGILAKLEGQPSGSYPVEVLVTASGSGWRTLTFDFGSNRVNSYPYGDGQPEAQPLSDLTNYSKLAIFIGFGTETMGTFLIDNITGGQVGESVPDTDSDGLIDTVDTCPADAGDIDNNGCPVVIVPVAAPETPSVSSTNVVSIYSAAYTAPVAVSEWSTSWGQGTTHTTVNITASYSVQQYTFADLGSGKYTGINMASGVDASATNNIHVDVWSADSSSFKLKIVDFGADGAYGGGDDVEDIKEIVISANTEWVGVDISLSDYPLLTTKGAISQFVIEGTSDGTIFIDNLYFYSTAIGASPSSSASIPSIAAANVVSIFSETYTAPVAVTRWSTDWGKGTTHSTEEVVTGDFVQKYSFVDGGEGRYTGVDMASGVDASNSNNFHLDVWSADLSSFKIKIVDFGADGAYGGGDDVDGGETEITITTSNQWQGVDIDLSTLTSLTTKGAISQFVIVGTADGTVYIDNLYFNN